MEYKKAIDLANKLTNKKCGDGLMKDVMKACLHWFIKVIYGEGYEIVLMPQDATHQRSLMFPDEIPPNTDFGQVDAKKVE